jgi:hypothetical protein
MVRYGAAGKPKINGAMAAFCKQGTCHESNSDEDFIASRWSIVLHSWAPNAALISASASSWEVLLDLNRRLQCSQIPIAGRGGFIILSFRFCI